MDYFIFPSISEGLGLAAVEAQAAGLPTIVSNEVPIDVIVTDSIERYSIKNGPKLWAERILISSKNSRKNRANDFLNSNYDIHIQVKKIEELYKKILEL
jgi:glycosyltransferase involved in cell wall biosynthesis